MTISLRPYQEDAIERARASVRAGHRRVLICAPTGAGKTMLAAEIMRSAYEMGSRSIFIAHRREILGQTVAKLKAAGIPEREIGVIMAGDPRRRPGAAVQVASVDTLRNRQIAAPDLVFVDEAHRALASSYVTISARWPDAVHVGLTATPTRLDGQGMADAYDDIVLVARVSELIAQGYLAEPRVFTVPSSSLPDLRGVKSTGGDYNGRQLAERVNQGALVGDIVRHWQERAEGRRTVCFAVSVEHSRSIVARFVEAGVAAEHLDGETPEPERAAILGRLERGETRVVSNVMVLTEGWDMPSVKVLIAARPTQSLVVWLQQAGRILRPWQDEQPLILDHAGCARQHGLPHEDREWSLEPTRRRRGKGEVDCAKICDSCLAVVPLGARVCPSCGAEMPWREQDLTEGEGELEEMLAGSVRLHEEYQRLVEEWRARNAGRMAMPKGRPIKPGWIFHAWKQSHGGRPPPKGCRPPQWSPEEQARVAELDGAPVGGELDQRVQVDAWQTKIETLARSLFDAPKNQGRPVQVGAILSALDLPIERWGQADQNRVARALGFARWRRVQRRVDGVRVWGYLPPDRLPFDVRVAELDGAPVGGEQAPGERLDLRLPGVDLDALVLQLARGLGEAPREVPRRAVSW